MIDEVVCRDWEAWKGWGAPQGGEGGRGAGEKTHRPLDLEGAQSMGRGHSTLSLLLGSRVKARASGNKGSGEHPQRPCSWGPGPCWTRAAGL